MNQLVASNALWFIGSDKLVHILDMRLYLELDFATKVWGA
jgi:hypothetical protein